jgi:MFS family permease
MAGITIAFCACRGLWGHFPFQLAFTVAAGFASGLVNATTLALFMDLTNPRLGATQFQIYMALLNIKDAWGQKLGGRLAEHMSAPALFGLSAIVELLPLAMLPWLDPRRAQADFARNPTPAATDAGNRSTIR